MKRKFGAMITTHGEIFLMQYFIKLYRMKHHIETFIVEIINFSKKLFL